eukprot:TRINITY_DN8973_c0_g2_i2.p1 TRINITY_DN8973_c0_g2~~TRINITY_DN8973_c0_g2_i2.p1  ORF type:complete len:356 (+),score=46.99 TRINITY_DN8973_c0_g2_i2:145-1068(+)
MYTPPPQGEPPLRVPAPPASLPPPGYDGPYLHPNPHPHRHHHYHHHPASHPPPHPHHHHHHHPHHHHIHPYPHHHHHHHHAPPVDPYYMYPHGGPPPMPGPPYPQQAPPPPHTQHSSGPSRSPQKGTRGRAPRYIPDAHAVPPHAYYDYVAYAPPSRSAQYGGYGSLPGAYKGRDRGGKSGSQHSSHGEASEYQRPPQWWLAEKVKLTADADDDEDGEATRKGKGRRGKGGLKGADGRGGAKGRGGRGRPQDPQAWRVADVPGGDAAPRDTPVPAQTHQKRRRKGSEPLGEPSPADIPPSGASTGGV